MSCNADCHKPRPHQAHCTVCHKTFTGVPTFDRHRRGGVCSDLGLSEVDGLWTTAEGHAGRAAKREAIRKSGFPQRGTAEADYHDYPHKENQ